jgi:DNA-binding winged helix-turn-helix (wHTH) protein
VLGVDDRKRQAQPLATATADARTISRGGRSVGLNRQEWTLLSLLVQREGGVVLREELLRRRSVRRTATMSRNCRGS